MFKFFMYKLGQFFVSRLPREAAYQLAIFVSDLHYIFSFRDRKAVKNNLRCILGSSQDLSKSTREIFRNFGKYLVEFFRMEKEVNQDYIRRNVRIENVNFIDQALQEGKGGIVITAHLGNWELGAVLLSVLGYPLMIIALPHKERPVNDLFNYQREVKGMRIVPPNLAMRQCLEHLKDNKVVALVADRDFSAHGEALDFLGQKTLIPKGAAIFSLKTGAPILPTFAIRNPDDTFTLIVKEPIYPQSIHKDMVDKEPLIHVMKKYAKVIEQMVYRYPTQWLMFQRFWIEEGPPRFDEKGPTKDQPSPATTIRRETKE